MNGPYDDIIDLPHHVSAAHPQMSMTERAAQFSPFAALTGYHAAIEETARLTDERIELDEDAKAVLDRRRQILQAAESERPQVSVTYFKKDSRKDGGAYRTVSGRIKKTDEFRRVLVMENGEEILFDDITGLDGELFGENS